MASTIDCYYCGYPVPPGAVVCPECGGAAKDFGPLREMHRTITNAWLALGLVLVATSLPEVGFALELLSGPRGAMKGAPLLLPFEVAAVSFGFVVGIAIIAWAVRAKLRKNAAPRFAVFLTLSVFLYVVAKALLFGLPLLVAG